jgi:iron complex outermembrane receptor protein
VSALRVHAAEPFIPRVNSFAPATKSGAFAGRRQFFIGCRIMDRKEGAMKIAAGSHRQGSQLVRAAVGLALASCASGLTYAQESPRASAQEGSELNEVVITGSRIVRRDYESQSPIVTVGTETLESRSATGIEAALNQLPQFTVAASAQANSQSSTPFPSPTATPGAATVNLRNLGVNRNLVLVDGRRVQPINGALAVDLNTIPNAVIQNVEVISGGAAAVYGADAISGVVNLITKKNFQGAQFDATYGITQEGDGQEYQLSALFGTNYADDRGNLMFGATYSDRGVVKGKDRAWVREGWNDPGTQSGGTVPSGSNLSSWNCGSICVPGFLKSGSIYVIDQNGKVFDPTDPLNPAHPYTGPLSYESGFKINPNGNLAWFDKENNHISVPLERYSIFASTRYNFNDHVSLFGEARFTENFSTAYGAHVGLFNIWSVQVPYNAEYDDPASPNFGQGPLGFAHHPVPAHLAELLNQRVRMIPDPDNPGSFIPDPTFDPRTAPWQYEGGVDWVPAYRTETTNNVYQLIAGLRGDIPRIKDWTWEIYASHGNTSQNAYLPESFLSHERVVQLFQADHYGKGWQNPNTLAVTGSCTSGLPIFNPDGSVNNTPSVSQDCADYVTLRMNNVTSIAQDIVEANVQGTLFDIWGGPLQFAAGSTYRSEKYKFTPDSGYNANQDVANVVNNIALPLGVSGTTSVKEAYIELAIPLLADLPFIKRLELNPGYRISDYNTSGTVSTWKATADWRVTDWVGFRGGFQHANRAPNVVELFSPIGASTIDFNSVDACGNWEGVTPTWGNHPDNPNRLNLQILCQHLMVRDGAPPSLYVPGEDSANNYQFNVFGQTNVFPFALAVQGGNPNLKSEVADTYTIGVVLRSPFEAAALQRLTLSVDYYNIDIEGAIDIPSHLTVYQQCLDARFNSLIGDAPGSHTGAELAANNPYCALIEREYLPAAGGVYGADRKFKAQYVNLGGIRTKGFDVQLDWASSFSALGLSSIPGVLSANVQYSYLDSWAEAPFPGSEHLEEKGTGVNFDYRVFTTLGYSNGSYSMGLRWQYWPGLDPARGAAANALGVSSHSQTDLFARWAFGRYELRAGVDNLFNADPEVVGAAFSAPGASSNNNARGSSFSFHDTFGRRFYIGMKALF